MNDDLVGEDRARNDRHLHRADLNRRGCLEPFRVANEQAFQFAAAREDAQAGIVKFYLYLRDRWTDRFDPFLDD